MNIMAKRIRIEFNNSSEDFWEATCQSGIRFDDAMRMIARAWKKYDNPKEPLIEDEKKRKAIQMWAEANSVKKVLYLEMPERILCRLEDTDDSDYEIDFVGHIPTLEDGEDYSIEELCGEEDKDEA